jgi:hypothetical protein
MKYNIYFFENIYSSLLLLFLSYIGWSGVEWSYSTAVLSLSLSFALIYNMHCIILFETELQVSNSSCSYLISYLISYLAN